MIKICKYIGFVLFMVTGIAMAAQLPSNISPQQLAQFKKLPPAQQQALAKSMGVDYNAIKAQLNKSTQNIESTENKPLQQYFPRGTQYDEEGNPIFQEDVISQELEKDDGKPKPFGYDVFANAPYTFAPTIDIAVPEKYIIGPGDILSLQMFGKENNEYQLEVSREGQIIVPELGPFNITGMTFLEAKKYLGNQIQNKVLGVDVIVTLSKLRSIRVFVLGDAFKPGPYVLNSLSSITHAIFASGGINEIGSLRNIQLKRNGKLITTLDLYDLLIKGDSSNDLLLKSGDVIFIAPVGERATIEGEVTRPAIYELTKGDTFQSLLQMAGGLLPSAYPSSTVVERFNRQNLRTVVNIDLSTQKTLKQSVNAGDYVRVMKTSELYEESVTVIGAVTRPGKYQWKKGQKVTDLLPNIHAYLADKADLTYSLIIREKDIGRNIEVLQFSIFKAISDNNSVDNIELRPRDKILFFSNIETDTAKTETLDDFALTKAELIERAKAKAEENYKERMFWQYYNDDPNLVVGSNNEADETLKQAYLSLEELTGTAKNDVDIKDLGYFSRKRMLAPVVEQLRRQAASGEPMQIVEIDGAVKYPGIYPLSKGAKAIDIVVAAGGLLESAYLVKAEITRDQIDDEMANKLTLSFNLSAALKDDESQNIEMKSKDRLNIHHIPAWQENHIVELKGEFKFPGKYTIRRGESLKQLIERVDGFTEYADIEASLFTREKLKKMELENIIKVSESLRMEIASKSLAQRDSNQGLDYEQARVLLADLTKVTPIGRLVVDIPRIISKTDTDIVLENGDVLYVPTKQDSINVVGQVQVATSHIYQPGLDAIDYIELSGGLKKQADDERIYVIKANGSVQIPSSGNWFASNEHTLRPGDTVVVPLDSSYMENITLWQVSTQIIYQAAVAIAAISGI
ncbi:SLBB domain-containing protein [Thalassotalea profundi]|uniref:Sugar transporter n=1 Tax=Thalassotalea profundi TaxID=2036687 RepID=A0ABQ3IGL2_9GAMM|nr:SLBB domain-containing protein [Thalassotalea profundi]GHE80681.1 sugar transporter [Thalassotalea profundi]